jgi:hypothetical protein
VTEIERLKDRIFNEEWTVGRERSRLYDQRRIVAKSRFLYLLPTFLFAVVSVPVFVYLLVLSIIVSPDQFKMYGEGSAVALFIVSGAISLLSVANLFEATSNYKSAPAEVAALEKSVAERTERITKHRADLEVEKAARTRRRDLPMVLPFVQQLVLSDGTVVNINDERVPSDLRESFALAVKAERTLRDRD